MTTWNTIKLAILALSALAATAALAEIQKSNELDRMATANIGALAGHRYRVLVSTGGNCQTGFVDICDTPYDEIVQAAREVGDILYEYRLKN